MKQRFWRLRVPVIVIPGEIIPIVIQVVELPLKGRNIGTTWRKLMRRRGGDQP